MWKSTYSYYDRCDNDLSRCSEFLRTRQLCTYKKDLNVRYTLQLIKISSIKTQENSKVKRLFKALRKCSFLNVSYFSSASDFLPLIAWTDVTTLIVRVRIVYMAYKFYAMCLSDREAKIKRYYGSKWEERSVMLASGVLYFGNKYIKT